MTNGRVVRDERAQWATGCSDRRLLVRRVNSRHPEKGHVPFDCGCQLWLSKLSSDRPISTSLSYGFRCKNPRPFGWSRSPRGFPTLRRKCLPRQRRTLWDHFQRLASNGLWNRFVRHAAHRRVRRHTSCQPQTRKEKEIEIRLGSVHVFSSWCDRVTDDAITQPEVKDRFVRMTDYRPRSTPRVGPSVKMNLRRSRFLKLSPNRYRRMNPGRLTASGPSARF